MELRFYEYTFARHVSPFKNKISRVAINDPINISLTDLFKN